MSLVDQVRLAGVVGAGGGGFPAHVKLGSKAEIIIANGAECEPLLHKDAAVMEHYAADVVRGVELSMAATGAQDGVIGIKAKKKDTVEAIEEACKGTSVRVLLPGLRRARSGPIEISRGWSAANPPDDPTHPFKPRQGRQKFPVRPQFARICRPIRGSRGLWDRFRGFRSFLAPPPANFFGPSRGRSHVRTKANPIGVAAYALQSKLPGELKGKLPTAKQLADIVRAEMEGGK